MVCKINCAAIIGIDVQPVVVETDVCNGLPAFDMVGLLASDIKESRERVRTAIKNSGFMLPPKRITINFSPANIRKTGTYFDLPVAVSILQALDIVRGDMADKMFIGELSLNGDVAAVNGVLPIVLCAMEQGIKQCFVSMENVAECDFLDDIQVAGIKNLNQLVMILNGQDDSAIRGNDENEQENSGIHSNNENEQENGGIHSDNEDEQENSEKITGSKGESVDCLPAAVNVLSNRKIENAYDFKDIKGQAQARRGAEIAAAGMHNMLMIGPPGTGKSVIAKAMPFILPDMLRNEQIEVSKIQSIMGTLKGGLATERPFRSPHYTATVSAMTGGGLNPKPGEITLAHNGVLYMDEFPEFSRAVIETLRQPMEDRKIVVSRSGGTYEFPADFMLLASMNPCRCGYYPDRNKCNCTERDVKKYMEKVSGPIMDRMDLWVHMNTVTFYELKDHQHQEDSATIRERVNRAVRIQRERYRNENINFNGQLSGEKIEKFCLLGKKERELMEQIYEKFDLSVRGYEKIIKVARTIADLKEKEKISTLEIAEAVSFRQI